MTVRVIHKTESVIYKKEIYRLGDTFAVATSTGNSLIKRGYVEKISDTPVFSDSTVDETVFDRVIVVDSTSGDEHQFFVQDGHAYFEKREA